jgi:CheY-like chemotaxis protein
LALDILRPILAPVLAFWFAGSGYPLGHLHLLLIAVVSANSIAGIVTALRPTFWFLRAAKFAGDILVLGPLLALTGGMSSPFVWLAPLLLLTISLTLPWQAEAVYVPLLLTSLALGLLHAPGTIPTFDLVAILVLAGGVALATNWAKQLYEQERLLSGEVAEAQKELARAQEELMRGEELRVIGETSLTMSHEFNNLLATVRGKAEMLLRQETDSERKEQLEQIKERALHGAELVRRMRSASSPDDPLELKSVSPTVLLEELIGEIRDARSDASWTVTSSFRNAALSLPAKTVKRIFEQLLAFISATMPQGARLTLSATDTVGNAFGIRLVAEPSGDPKRGGSDSLIGNSEDDMELSVQRVRSMLRDLSGELQVERHPDGTVAFVIAIPTSEEPPVKETRRRILIVDDEDSVRAVLVDMVDLLGHEADGAAGGTEALMMLDRTEYDVVISDVGMPEMDGVELVSRIKEKWADIPVILVSGWGLEECEETADAFSGVWVLEKPVQIPVLEKTLAEITGEPPPF